MATITKNAIFSEEGKTIVTRETAGRMWQYFVATTRALNAATGEAHMALCDQALAYLDSIIKTGRMPAVIG